MELQVAEEQVVDRSVFSSSDKVIKVTGCNFELDCNANEQRCSESKGLLFSLPLWNA